MKPISLLFLAWFSLALLPSTQLHAQTKQYAHGRSIESFPYPFAKMFYIQPRFDRVYNDDGTYLNSYVLRAFSTYWNNWHFRVEIPFADSNTSGKDVFGLSDINIRAVHATRLHDKLFLGYGAQLVMNTATDNSLGGGKWDIRPGIGLIYFRGTSEHVTGTNLLSVEYRTTITKEGGVQRTNVLAIAPNIDWWIGRWYFGYYATWTYNFDSEIFDLPIDVEAGYSFTPKLTVAGEFIYPLLNRVSYKNEFAVKLRYSF